MSDDTPAHNTNQSSGTRVLSELVLQPGGMSRVSIQLDTQNDTLEPLVAYEPNTPDILATSVERTEEGNTTTFLYHFQNFGDVECQITVSLPGVTE